jgi:hypothetical protein
MRAIQAQDCGIRDPKGDWGLTLIYVEECCREGDGGKIRGIIKGNIHFASFSG